MLVIATVDITNGSGGETPALPAGPLDSVNQSSVSGTSCLYLDRPC